MKPRTSLTPREESVRLLILMRLTDKEIAYSLGIVERTAKFHVSRVLAKTDSRNRNELILREMNKP